MWPRLLPSRSSHLVRYGIGFAVSLLLTLGIFIVVAQWRVIPFWPPTSVVATIMLVAAAQVVVQVICFLHLDQEKRPRWNSASFVFTLFVIVILVGGSLWIMSNLHYNMMNSQQIKEYIETQNKKGF